MDTNAPIKILIVDDSFFMRNLMRDLFNDETEIKIVGEAKNGVEAVKLTKELLPDIITMDYNMPEMNGAEATRNIMSSIDSPPAIIMVSASTREGGEATLECLRAGAVDFITKPSGEVSFDIDKVKAELLNKIRIATKIKQRKPKIYKETEVMAPIRRNLTAKAVIIGASTGGPPVVEDILAGLRPEIKASVIVVQHMPEKFTKSFADRLDKKVPLKTKEAEEGEMVKQGMCLVAPGDFHTHIEIREDAGLFNKVIHLTKEPPIFGLRPAIDITMQAAAHCYAGELIGVILTGMGHDGTEGMRAIKLAGGHTIIQSPETALIDSMPSSVAEAGVADESLPAEKIADRIMELCS